MQTIADGRYELEAEIAAGAIGTVWRARDLRTGEHVAIKLLRPEAATQPALVDAFLSEARILLSLSHPCVVRARELVPVGTGFGLVLDLVNGQDLRRRLRTDGPLPPAVAVDVVAQVADALAYLHGAGIVHGDVKPGNILVPVDGSPVRLTDFGVARRLAEAGQGRATHATPEYVAPEVIGGAAPRPSTDVYALGIVLYELFCGRTPYRGGAAEEVLYRHISCVPVPPAGFPESVWPLVTACLSPDPGARPDAGTVAHRLRTVQLSLGALAPLPVTGPEAVTWRPRESTMPLLTTSPAPVVRTIRHPRLLVGLAGAAALVLLLAGLGVALMLHDKPKVPVTQPAAVVSSQPVTSRPSSAPSTAPASTGSGGSGPTSTAPTDNGPTNSGPTNSGPTDAGTTSSDPTDAPATSGPTDGGDQTPPMLPGLGGH